MVATLVEQVEKCISQKGFSSVEAKPMSILVGYSGGVDSQVLLHIFAELRNKLPELTVRAIHINHDLSPNADQWQAHCRQYCDVLHIPFIAEKVQIDKQKGGIEAAARTVRYDMYRRHLQQHEVLALAHHQDDQAETVLYRLMRGAGVKGLSGMTVAKGPFFDGAVDSREAINIIRPLLLSTKEQIIQYAKDNGLSWVEDESNENIHFSRNFLRHKILPEMEKHWPHAANSIARASRHCQEADELCGELAQQDAALCMGKQGRLLVEKIHQLSDIRQRNLLRYWIQYLSLPMPSESVLGNIQNELLNADESAQPLVVWGNAEARRFQSELYLMRSLSATDKQQSVSWDAISPINWKPLQKTIEVRESNVGLSKRYQGQLLSLSVRQGGERCRPSGRTGGSQKLKKLFQEYGLEPWLRDLWPILSYGDDIIALPGLFVCEHAMGDANDNDNLNLSLVP
ncbi:MAG: tRNA lysidine(34) synthetase TilS [Pseudomonadales bacterium]|nr:tRNA lysidine(34) synthetase TilS [Pseudomonadales bacterium]